MLVWQALPWSHTSGDALGCCSSWGRSSSQRTRVNCQARPTCTAWGQLFLACMMIPVLEPLLLRCAAGLHTCYMPEGVARIERICKRRCLRRTSATARTSEAAFLVTSFVVVGRPDPSASCLCEGPQRPVSCVLSLRKLFNSRKDIFRCRSPESATPARQSDWHLRYKEHCMLGFFSLQGLCWITHGQYAARGCTCQ